MVACHGVTFLDGGAREVAQLYMAVGIHNQGRGGVVKHDTGIAQDIGRVGMIEVDGLCAVADEHVARRRVLIVEDAGSIELTLIVRIEVAKSCHYLLWHLGYHAVPILVPGRAHLLYALRATEGELRLLAVAALGKDGDTQCLELFGLLHILTLLFY